MACLLNAYSVNVIKGNYIWKFGVVIIGENGCACSSDVMFL